MQNNYLNFKFLPLLTIMLLSVIIFGCTGKTGNTAQATASSSAAQPVQANQYATPPAFVEHPDTAKIEYPDTTLYYDDGKYIYAYNPRTQEREKLTSGVGVQMSHKKDRFSYTFYKYDPEFASSSKKQGFYIYNLQTNEDKFLYQAIENDPIGILEWSPNDSYIVTDAGTGVIREQSMIDRQTGKILVNLEILDHFTWYDPYTIIINERQEAHQKGMRPIESGGAYGITMIDITTNKKKILKHATPTENYYCLVVIEKNKILYQAVSIPVNKEWGNMDDEKETYWIMDDNGKTVEELKDYKEPPYNREDKLSNEVKTILPEPYRSYNSIYAAPLVNNWVIIYGDNRYQLREFFIMDKTNPNSLYKIGEGSSITW